MNIKDGDVITLNDGSKATVSLTPVIEKLNVSGRYMIQESQEFYHKAMVYGEFYALTEDDLKYPWIFVGTINKNIDRDSERNIFYSAYQKVYAMFGTQNLKYIIEEV